MQRPAVAETTALGAALMAGLALGVYSSLNDTARGWPAAETLTPQMAAEEKDRLLAGWKKAVDAALCWAEMQKL